MSSLNRIKAERAPRIDAAHAEFKKRIRQSAVFSLAILFLNESDFAGDGPLRRLDYYRLPADHYAEPGSPEAGISVAGLSIVCGNGRPSKLAMIEGEFGLLPTRTEAYEPLDSCMDLAARILRHGQIGPYEISDDEHREFAGELVDRFVYATGAFAPVVADGAVGFNDDGTIQTSGMPSSALLREGHN